MQEARPSRPDLVASVQETMFPFPLEARLPEAAFLERNRETPGLKMVGNLKPSLCAEAEISAPKNSKIRIDLNAVNDSCSTPADQH
jgi:hypothetical protein